jgi:hypothetical protein
MNPRYATPLEVYEGGSSKFEIPDGVEADIVSASLEHVMAGSVSYAALKLVATVGDETYEEEVLAGNSAQVGIEGNHFIPGPDSRAKAETFKLAANFAMGKLITSVLECGFQWNMETWDQTGWAQLEGHKFLIARVPVLDKDGNVKKRKSKDGSAEYPITNLTFVKWINAGGAQAGATAAASGGNATLEVQTKVEAAVSALLASGPMAKRDVMIKTAADGVDKPTTVKLINSPWFDEAERPWKTDKGTVAMK